MPPVNVRLHSPIGFVTLGDKLEGRELEIFEDRKNKLKQARLQRKVNSKSDDRAETRLICKPP